MTYKILSILDKYRLVVDISSRDGAKVGDKFIVYSQGEAINDPSSGDLIDYVDNIKAKLKLIHLQEKFSILESAEIETYTEDSPFFASLNQTARLFGPRVRKVLKPLDVEENDKVRKKDDAIIRVGDLVKKDLSE